MGERVALALGSNLGDRLSNLRAGLRGLGSAVAIDRVSSVYETAPLGIEDQPDFLNAVATGVTELKPRALLTRMHEVERECGRRRTVAGGPRTLDLDLVFYGDHVIRSRRLTVPHPRWRTRAFVCVPLAEIEPDRIDPESGTRVDEACGTLSTVGIRRFAGPSALENGS